MRATCSFFGFCSVISSLWRLCFLPTSPAALLSKSACSSFIMYPDCAFAVLCLLMDTGKCVLTTAPKWKQTNAFIFISENIRLVWPGKTTAPVTLPLSSVCKHLQHCLSRRWKCKVQKLSTPVLCALANRDWWLLAASLAGDTDMQSHESETLTVNTSLNMPTKAKIQSINCRSTATHLEVQAEPNGGERDWCFVGSWQLMCNQLFKKPHPWGEVIWQWWEQKIQRGSTELSRLTLNTLSGNWGYTIEEM